MLCGRRPTAFGSASERVVSPDIVWHALPGPSNFRRLARSAHQVDARCRAAARDSRPSAEQQDSGIRTKGTLTPKIWSDETKDAPENLES
eukprot:3259860-Amphidinium_carterae.1